jgi:hypothetical protein
MSKKIDEFGFYFSDYEDTLVAYMNAGYQVTGFNDYLANPAKKHLILRHDCDNSLTQALKIATIENRLGCTATYFVRVHATGYNLLSLPSLIALREIESLGHKIELHLEGGVPDYFNESIDSWCDAQRTIFEAAVGRQVEGFSTHEPARMGKLDYADELLERWGVKFHAYEKRFMSPSIKYLSDSSASWREGHFRMWVDKEPVLQVLTHPIWWFDKVSQENY